jgi:transforming growth factor-beta-induced protein
MKRFTLLSVVLTASMILAACAPATPAPTAEPLPEPTAVPTEVPAPVEMPKTIVDIAVADGRFTTLVAAVQAAGLAETLSGEGPFTVFAPTDEAFKKLPAGTVEALLKDIPALKDILLYHVVSGKVMASDVVKLESADTVLGKPVSIKVDMGKVYVNDAQVIITDIEASNGVIHVIDAVLLPPTDKAMMEKDIVDTAVADGRFTTLAAALTAAGLVETLKGAGPFTVFAPTDDAFAKLPAGTVEALLKDIPALKDILLYHVVSGKVMAADVVMLKSADTVLGKPISIKVMDGKVYLNDTVEVLITDVIASNGVIHVIDSVLLPPK